jgi:glycosyltransferase involved in cell wall biosynthesis
VVREGDVEGMATALAELLGDPQKRRLYGEAGRRRAAERYDTPRQIARLEGVLLDSMERSGR